MLVFYIYEAKAARAARRAIATNDHLLGIDADRSERRTQVIFVDLVGDVPKKQASHLPPRNAAVSWAKTSLIMCTPRIPCAVP